MGECSSIVPFSTGDSTNAFADFSSLNLPEVVSQFWLTFEWISRAVDCFGARDRKSRPDPFEELYLSLLTRCCKFIEILLHNAQHVSMHMVKIGSRSHGHPHPSARLVHKTPITIVLVQVLLDDIHRVSMRGDIKHPRRHGRNEGHEGDCFLVTLHGRY